MKVRIISAIVAIALAIPFIYFGSWSFSVAVGILAILGFKEAIDLKKSHGKIPFIPSVIAMTACLLLIYTNFNGDMLIYGATYKRLIFTILSLLIPTVFYKNDEYTTKDAFYLMGFVLFIGISFNSFILVRDKGLDLFFYLLLIPVCTDTFAYVMGSLIGKHKMCPKISPKKSWEGFIFGLLFGSVIPVVAYLLMFNEMSIGIVLGTMILSFIGQIGDLIFSKIKRENDIKDFSNIMPGHGGILDRLDSAIIIFMTFIFLSTVLY